MSWTFRGSNPGGGDIFPTRSDWLWSLPRLLYSGYQDFFPGAKRPERGVDCPPLSTTEVNERVQLYPTPTLCLQDMLQGKTRRLPTSSAFCRTKEREVNFVVITIMCQPCFICQTDFCFAFVAKYFVHSERCLDTHSATWSPLLVFLCSSSPIAEAIYKMRTPHLH